MSDNQKSLSKSLHRVKHTDRRIVKPAISLILVMTMLLLHVIIPVVKVEAQGFVTTPMVSAGWDHSLALKSDGTVWAWGSNHCGQLGDGTTTKRLTPVQVSGLTNVVAVSAGNTNSLALKQDGTVWAWGSNEYGQLGDGTTKNRHIPVRVSSLAGVQAISAGSYFSLALRQDGTVWAWGQSPMGVESSQLATDDRYGIRYTAKPLQVSGLTGIKAVSIGWKHSLAVREDGTVWVWGFGSMLFEGKWLRIDMPIQVSGLMGVVAVSAGESHSLALKGDGTVWAWGANRFGQIGDGTRITRDRPVQIKGLTDVQAISANSFSWGGDSLGYHSLALKSDGTVWTWGTNWNGWLGDGTKIDRLSPVQLKGLSDMQMVSAGAARSLAIKSDGTVWAWGYNVSGQLGDGTTTSRTVPVQSQINLGRVTSPMAEIKIYIEGTRQEFNDPIVIQEGRTLVPMRAFFEAMGADVNWDPDTRTAIGVRGGIEVRIPIDSIHPTVNQQRVTIDVPARIIEGRTYIPLRFVGEALGDEVGWDGDTRTITITR